MSPPSVIRLDTHAYGVDEYGRPESFAPHCPGNLGAAAAVAEPGCAVDEPRTPDAAPLRINWLHLILLTGTPLIALYGMCTTELTRKTMIWCVVYYFITGLGITAGCHRLWAHKSYKATLPLQLFLVGACSGAVEGSIRWWCRNHRAHHRYTDSEKDPYNAKRGLFFSHIGWMLEKQDVNKIGRVDISDLNADPLVQFQHRHYPYFAMFFGLIFPTLVAGLGWGDWRGGYFLAGVARLVFVHHATFCVNSLAHYIGERTYDDRRTPADHVFTALVTVGEGYHNFHHEFPSDYRNAILYYQYDPTKWFIKTMSYLGMAYDLQCFPRNEIDKGATMVLEKKIIRMKDKLSFGTSLNALKKYTMSEFESAVKENDAQWVIINGVIHDVEKFMEEHPGGKSLIKSGVGKDMTDAFNGEVYDHSNAARNLLQSLRVGVIEHGKYQ